MIEYVFHISHIMRPDYYLYITCSFPKFWRDVSDKQKFENRKLQINK